MFLLCFMYVSFNRSLVDSSKFILMNKFTCINMVLLLLLRCVFCNCSFCFCRQKMLQKSLIPTCIILMAYSQRLIHRSTRTWTASASYSTSSASSLPNACKTIDWLTFRCLSRSINYSALVGYPQTEAHRVALVFVLRVLSLKVFPPGQAILWTQKARNITVVGLICSPNVILK